MTRHCSTDCTALLWVKTPAGQGPPSTQRPADLPHLCSAAAWAAAEDG